MPTVPQRDQSGVQATRAARKKQREQLRGPHVNLVQARAQALLITNPARQKLMLETIDELERMRDKVKSSRERIKRQRAEREFIEANMTRMVTDDEGRKWALAKDLPDGSSFVDAAGILWKYNASERHLSRLTDG